MNYYRDKVVWITGASSGIGLALAHELAKAGAKLALSGRNVKALEEFKSVHASQRVLLLPFDVTDKTQHQLAVNQMMEAYQAIDIVFLNAGIGASGANKLGRQDDFDSETLEAIFQVNLFAVAYSIEALLPVFKAQQRGHIVATASLAAYVALSQAAAYSASKAALRSMMRSIATAYKKIIKVSILYPGFIATPMTQHFKKMPQVVTAERAAKIIAKRVARQQEEIAFPFFMSMMSKFAGRLPLKWFKHLPGTGLK